MTACKKIGSVMLMTLLVMTALIQGAAASEIDLNIPMLDVSYNIWGYATTVRSSCFTAWVSVFWVCFSDFMNLSKSRECRRTS